MIAEEGKKNTNWADETEEPEEEILPPPTITIEEGDKGDKIKVVVEYKKNDKGQTVKATTRYRIMVYRTLNDPQIAKRKQWKKFGMCKDAPPGLEKGVTEVSPEDIPFVLGAAGSAKQEEVKETDKPVLNIECRICKQKGDHYSAYCPMKDVYRAQGVQQDEDAPVKDDAGKPGVYKPPNKRGTGEEGSKTVESRDELPTVRVSNLSEYAHENDLQELFKPFGPIQRVFIAKDKKTGESRGFGFVTFFNRGDAAKAISKLDGYGYDHLILHLEWALPSKK